MTRHKWQFFARFRAGQYRCNGTAKAKKNLKVAVSEIKKVGKKDPSLAAEGATRLLEKLVSPIEGVDGSSGAIGLWLALVLAICELFPSLNVAETREQEHRSLTSRFELQYYTQGNSMSHPQNTPPSVSVSYKAEKRPSAASLSFTSVADDSQVEELGAWEEKGDARYRNFWGQGADLQSNKEPSKAEWSTYGLSTFIWSEEIAGKYLLMGDGASSNIELLPSQTKSLKPTSIAPVEADPAEGFSTRWSPVKAQLGTKRVPAKVAIQITLNGTIRMRTGWYSEARSLLPEGFF